MTNDFDFFPHLKIAVLKAHAERWAQEFNQGKILDENSHEIIDHIIRIQRIVLYKSGLGAPYGCNYVLVFDVPEIKDEYKELIWYHDLLPNQIESPAGPPWIGRDFFDEVYKHPPHDISDEWIFKRRIPGFNLNAEIVEKSKLVLYEYERETSNDVKHANGKKSADQLQPSQKLDSGIDKYSFVFRKTGPTWTIIYEGTELHGLSGKGFTYIHYLVMQKEKIFHTDELSKEVEGTQLYYPVIDSTESYSDLCGCNNGYKKKGKRYTGCNDLIYGKSETELRKHWLFLQKEVSEAEKNNDLHRLTKAKADLEEFATYASEYFGLGGKVRKHTDATTKTKNRITKCIERALNSLKNCDEEGVYRHFQNALSPINSYELSYTPDRDIDWVTE